MFEEKIAALNEQNEKRMAVEAKTFEKRTYSVDEIQDILGIGRTSVDDAGSPTKSRVHQAG